MAETVRILESKTSIGGREYTMDITIEMSSQEPFTITVTAHYDGLTVEEQLEAQPNDIRDLFKHEDCLKLVRDHNMISQATDDLAALMIRKGDALQ